MSFYLKLQKQTIKKREYGILKVHPVSSFALPFPVYVCLVVNNDFFASQPCTTECTARFRQRLHSESSQTCLCLAVMLMHLFNFWDGLYWWIILILDTRLCLTCSTVLQWGNVRESSVFARTRSYKPSLPSPRSPALKATKSISTRSPWLGFLPITGLIPVIKFAVT